LTYAKGKHIESTLENASSAPAVILQTITSENPELRYTIGAATIIRAIYPRHSNISMVNIHLSALFELMKLMYGFCG